MKNDLSTEFTQEERTTINNAIALIWQTLLNKLVKLTPDERMELPKLGKKHHSFVSKVIQYAEQNPELAPAYLDLDEMKKDVSAMGVFQEIAGQLEPLLRDINDSMSVAGSEAVGGGYIFYGAVRDASGRKIGAAETIYKDLRGYFPGRPREKKGD